MSDVRIVTVKNAEVVDTTEPAKPKKKLAVVDEKYKSLNITQMVKKALESAE